jgi:DNA-binding NarL/FixJ family response regulator
MRVAVAENHAWYRDSLAMFLEAAGQEVIACAASGTELLHALDGRALDGRAPDVAVLDLMMPPGEAGGLRTAGELRARHPCIGVLFLTNHDDAYWVRQAVPTYGPRSIGYWTKEAIADIETLLAVLHIIARGDPSIEPRLLNGLLAEGHPVSRLSPREQDVLAQVAAGASSKAIADRLTVATKTVEGNLGAIYRKLGVPTGPADNPRVHAANMWADYQRRLLPPGSRPD